jgi:hypothetical protein
MIKRKKTTKSGSLDYIIIDKTTGGYSAPTSAEKASEIHKDLSKWKIRDHVSIKKENWTKGRFIILALRKGRNMLYKEESLIDILK